MNACQVVRLSGIVTPCPNDQDDVCLLENFFITKQAIFLEFKEGPFHHHLRSPNMNKMRFLIMILFISGFSFVIHGGVYTVTILMKLDRRFRSTQQTFKFRQKIIVCPLPCKCMKFFNSLVLPVSLGSSYTVWDQTHCFRISLTHAGRLKSDFCSRKSKLAV